VNGIPFKIDLLSSTINLNDEEILVKEYFSNKGSSLNILGTIKKYTIGLPSLLLRSFNSQDAALSKSEIYSVSQEDKELFDIISGALSLSINDKEGFITISFTDNNKNVAAQITQISQNLLQEKIIEFKISLQMRCWILQLNNMKKIKILMKKYKMKEQFLLIRI
jgi:hypothetical protein